MCCVDRLSRLPIADKEKLLPGPNGSESGESLICRIAKALAGGSAEAQAEWLALRASFARSAECRIVLP